MKIISWNCRGLRNPSTIRTLCNLIRSCSAQIVFLSETHFMTDFSHYATLLGFDNCCQVPAVSAYKGGLVLLWSSDVDLIINHSSTHLIHGSITYMQVTWDIVFIYSEPNQAFRRQFWRDQTLLLQNIDRPLLCCGDFNDLLQISDKFGGIQVRTRNTSNLQFFTNSLGLLDLGYIGPALTWSNNQSPRLHVRERLDRAFGNADWNILFPYATVHHLPRVPLLINITPQASRRRRRYFMYENHWNEHPQLKNIIRSSWTSSTANSGSFLSNLSNTAAALQRWNASTFKKIPKKIAMLKT